MTESTPSFIMQYKESELADDMADARRAGAWDTLVRISKSFTDVEKWLKALSMDEDLYMTVMYSDLPEAKKKDGEWKFRKFKFTDADGKEQFGGLPMSYLTAKSTIKQAMENKIQLLKKGKTVPKTELGKFIAAVKDPTTAFQKVINHLKRIEGLWGSITPAERSAILVEFDSFSKIGKS